MDMGQAQEFWLPHQSVLSTTTYFFHYIIVINTTITVVVIIIIGFSCSIKLDSRITGVISITAACACIAGRLKPVHYFGSKCILVELLTVTSAVFSCLPPERINIY